MAHNSEILPWHLLASQIEASFHRLSVKNVSRTPSTLRFKDLDWDVFGNESVSNFGYHLDLCLFEDVTKRMDKLAHVQ